MWLFHSSCWNQSVLVVEVSSLESIPSWSGHADCDILFRLVSRLVAFGYPVRRQLWLRFRAAWQDLSDVLGEERLSLNTLSGHTNTHSHTKKELQKKTQSVSMHIVLGVSLRVVPSTKRRIKRALFPWLQASGCTSLVVGCLGRLFYR